MDGGSPLSPDRTGNAVSPAAYRDGMAAIAGQVHLITTAGPAGRSGFTALAVASVSDDPATLLVCLNRKSANGDLIASNRTFAVNALPADAEMLAETFAGRTGLTGEARFGAGLWDTMTTGAPTLASALASFDCELLDLTPVATHVVIMGRVVAVRTTTEGAALSYFRRGYRRVTA